jgi:ufm1-conjugating enzyme 1
MIGSEWALTRMVDEATKKTLGSITLLKTKAGPRDKDLWVQRLKEEYQALIQVERQ